MGRARGKLTLKHIQNERARRLTFNQRNKVLAKKVSDFSSKFGVEACLIVYDGDGDGRPMTTPQDSTIVRSMLEKYEQQKIEGTTPKEFDVKDYFENKKNKVEVEISRVHKEFVKKKYPTWDPSFSNMDGEQLKAFTAIVNAKIEACDQRIRMLNSHETPNRQHTLDDQTSATAMHDIPQWQHTLDDHLKQVYDDPLKPLDDIINETVDFTNHASFPPVSSTNKIGQVVDFDDLMAEPKEWANQLGEFDELDDLVAEEWNTQPEKEWIHQPEVFEWQDISFLSQNEHRRETLDAFP